MRVPRTRLGDHAPWHAGRLRAVQVAVAWRTPPCHPVALHSKRLPEAQTAPGEAAGRWPEDSLKVTDVAPGRVVGGGAGRWPLRSQGVTVKVG